MGTNPGGLMKKAVLIGINYPNTSHALKGCINDVLEMKQILEQVYKFDSIKMLTDSEATTAGMLSALNTLVNEAKPGDILYVHYSGHGSQMINPTESDTEADGLDEIICPIDLNWKDKVIRDDDLRKIFDRVPSGVNLTVTLDCCNSGGGLDHEYQYQPDVSSNKEIENNPGRFLPPPDHLAPEIMFIGKAQRQVRSRSVDDTGLLISGCQSHQTSADAFIGGKYMGACTYAMSTLLRETEGDITYKELVDRMNQKMVELKFTQRPELNGPVGLFEKDMLSPANIVESTDEPITPTNVSSSTKEDSKKKKKKMLLGLIVVVAIVVTFLV